MNKVGAKRLLKLASFLDKLHYSKFNLNEWVTGRNPQLMSEEPTETGECGTTACAVGWLPKIFPRSWSWHGGQPDNMFGEPVPFDVYYQWGKRRDRGNHGKLKAASEFFSIDIYEAQALFMPDEYRAGPNTTAKAVAKRIRSIVKEHKYEAV